MTELIYPNQDDPQVKLIIEGDVDDWQIKQAFFWLDAHGFRDGWVDCTSMVKFKDFEEYITNQLLFLEGVRLMKASAS